MKRLMGAILPIGILLLTFQNCSKVDYANDSVSSENKATGFETPATLPAEVVTPQEQVDQTEYLNEIIATSPACAMEARNLNYSSTVNLGGQNFGGNVEASWNGKLYQNGGSVRFNGSWLSLVGVQNANSATFNGSYGTVYVENAKFSSFNGDYQDIIVRSPDGDVNPANGSSRKLFISAKKVSVNGNHQNLCAVGDDILVNGGVGTGAAPTVLMGRSSESVLRTLNGNRFDVLIHQLKTNVINGSQRDLYISKSEVGTLNGTADEVYIFNGSHVKSINGVYRRIYLFNGSQVDSINGDYQMIRTSVGGMPVRMLSL